MEKYEITARHLFIELTETVFIDDADHANEILKGIRAMGVGVALDDFGTGYSSLSYLVKMQVDTIKIDRSFVVKLPGDQKSRAMMEYIIGLMHDLGYKVVVEGVEEKDQADYLKSIGCDAIQGYYYHRPMSIEKIRKLLMS
jgi:EAL domain-containing protein (putative c-di-GMP-specific phosphodiesterase class I)